MKSSSPHERHRLKSSSPHERHRLKSSSPHAALIQNLTRSLIQTFSSCILFSVPLRFSPKHPPSPPYTPSILFLIQFRCVFFLSIHFAVQLSFSLMQLFFYQFSSGCFGVGFFFHMHNISCSNQDNPHAYFFLFSSVFPSAYSFLFRLVFSPRLLFSVQSSFFPMHTLSCSDQFFPCIHFPV